MRKLSCVFVVLSAISAFGQLDQITTSAQAREYAADHMWTEVQVLTADDCRWLFQSESGDKTLEPNIGDEVLVRNSRYKIIADTNMHMIQCAVIDFSLTEMSTEEADSAISVMLYAYKRLGSFAKVADEYLSAEEKYRYVLFHDYSAVLAETFGENFEERAKGEIFVIDQKEDQPFKFIVYIREDPYPVDGFIVLKIRAEE